MKQKRRIEVFTAGCALCAETLDLVRQSVSSCGCEVIERRCEGTERCETAENYRITKMPTVVIDGRIAFEGLLTEAQAELLRQ